MNVYFPSAETDSAKQSINVDRATTAYRTSTQNAERAGRSSFTFLAQLRITALTQVTEGPQKRLCGWRDKRIPRLVVTIWQ